MRFVGSTFIVLSLVNGMLALLTVLFNANQYWLGAAALPRGTFIRPMGIPIAIAMLGLWTFFIGVPLGEIGWQTCQRTGHAKGALWGKRAIILNAIPVPLALLCFYLIPAYFGLKFAD